MNNKNSKIKPLTDYEESLIWMSYRYAIGRHTIHAHCHACDILSHEYERLKLTPNRMEFMSKDINRSIEDSLRFSRLNVYVNNVYNMNLHIIDYLIKSIIDEQGYVKYDLRYIHKINLDCYGSDCDFSYEISEKIVNEYPWNDLDDLMIWYNVAKIFDLKSHKKCFLTDCSEVEFVELYERITEYSEDHKNDKVKFELYRVPIEKYVKNPAIWTYIPDSSIDWNKTLGLC